MTIAYFAGGSWCHSWCDRTCQKRNPSACCIRMGASPGSAVLSVRNSILGETHYKLSRGTVCTDATGERSSSQVQMDEVVYNLRMMTGYRHQKERRGVMAHTFLQEITGCLLLSFFLTTSFKCKFVLIPLDFQAFLFFFFFLTLKKDWQEDILVLHSTWPQQWASSLSAILGEQYPHLSLY